MRGLLHRKDHTVRSVQEVAAALGTSERSLRRQLAAEGVSFSSLLEEERLERAKLLLLSTAMSIDHIAARLGYSNVANFGRAFRRWTDHTPADYRRAHRAGR